MSRKKPDKNPANALIPTVKDPFKSKPYVDPLKIPRGEYKDPLRVSKEEYKDPLRVSKEEYKDPLRVSKEEYKDPLKSITVKLPEYKPYNSYHEYELPDIDPLTGKPRSDRPPMQKKEEEIPKKGKKPLGKSIFPSQVGSSVGSVKRMLRIQENLNF